MKRLFITLFALIVVGFSQVTTEVTPLLGSTNTTTVGTITTGVWDAGAVTSTGAGTFTGSVIIGSADVNEAELEIIDGATITTAEVNLLDGSGIANSTVSVAAVLNSGGDLVTASNVGAIEGNGVVAAEYGDGFNHVTILTLTATVLGTPDPGNALAFGDTIYVFPAGVQIVEWFQTDIGLTTSGVTTDTPEQGIGSVMAAGAQATLGAAGATMEDYFTGTAVTNCDGSIENHGPLGATAGIFTGIALNKAADVKNVCLNVADTWDASVTGTLLVSGTIAFKWTFLD